MKPITAIILAVAACLVGVAVGFQLGRSSAVPAPAAAPAAAVVAEAATPEPAKAPASAPRAPTTPVAPGMAADAPALPPPGGAPDARPAPVGTEPGAAGAGPGTLGAPPAAVAATPLPPAVDWKGSPALGDPLGAKVIVIEFSDFQCPVCKRAAEELHPLLGTLVQDSSALIVFKQNPLEMHKNAKPAALASAAAHRQGKFWAFHDKLFELNHLLGDDSTYTGVAKGLGLDLSRFDADRKGKDLEERVMAEAKVATDLDARGTPAYFVNGKKQVGWGSALGLKGMIDAEKREVDKLMAQGKSRDEAVRERIKLNSDKATADEAVKELGP